MRISSNLEILVLSKPDIVITKAARLDEGDVADIQNCGQSWRVIVKRYADYAYHD